MRRVAKGAYTFTPGDQPSVTFVDTFKNLTVTLHKWTLDDLYEQCLNFELLDFDLETIIRTAAIGAHTIMIDVNVVKQGEPND